MFNWHKKHEDETSFGDRVADRVASFVGSWRFIFIQSGIMTGWVIGNAYLLFHFDPFPFIFLNLFMSAEAAFSTPIIMMSQNRQNDRDRKHAESDFQTNIEAENRIEILQKDLSRIENEKLDRLIELLADVTQALAIIATVEERAGPNADERLRVVLEKLENIIEHR